MTLWVSLLFLAFLGMIVARVPIAFALLAVTLPVFFLGDGLSPWVISQSMFAGVDSFVFLAIPLFILAGKLMNAAHITDRLIRFAYALVGSVRGGLGMVNVVTSMGFAGVSGSSTADTAGVGSVLIPQMRARGYPLNFTVSVTAASSVMGTIIPPSISMVLWGALTNTSIGSLFLAGVIPGLLVGGAMIGYVYLVARRQGFPREERLELGELWRAFRAAIPALGIPVLVIGGIVLGVVTATEASVLAVVYALVLGTVVYRSINPAQLLRVAIESAKLAALTLFAIAAASVLGYTIAYYRIPAGLESSLDGVPPLLLFPVIILIWLVLGCFLDSTPAMTIMIPVLAPAVAAAGLDPVHYGIVSVMTLALGLITPPYGLCLLLSAHIAGVPVSRVLRSVSAFVLLMLAIIALVATVPQLTLWLPGTLGMI